MQIIARCSIFWRPQRHLLSAEMPIERELSRPCPPSVYLCSMWYLFLSPPLHLPLLSPCALPKFLSFLCWPSPGVYCFLLQTSLSPSKVLAHRYTIGRRQFSALELGGDCGGVFLHLKERPNQQTNSSRGFVIVEGCLSWSRVLPTYLFLSPYLCIVVLRQCTALRSDGFVFLRHKATSVFGICRR